MLLIRSLFKHKGDCLMRENVMIKRSEIFFESFKRGDEVYFIHPNFPNFFVRRKQSYEAIKRNGMGPFVVLQTCEKNGFHSLIFKNNNEEVVELCVDFFTKKDDILRYLHLIKKHEELLSALSN